MGKPWANYHLEMQLLQDALKLARRDRGVVSNYTPGSNIGSNGGTMLWWAPLKLRHWPVSQACETSTPAKQKLNSNCCWYFWKSEIVPLRHRMPGGGSTFGDGAIRWLSPLGREELVIALSASAEKLAAMWCNGARQGLLSALDYKIGCAILLPNTTRRRRRRNKVVNVAIIDRQLLLLSTMFVHRVKGSCLHLLDNITYHVMHYTCVPSCMCPFMLASCIYQVRLMYLISNCVVRRSCAIKQDLEIEAFILPPYLSYPTKSSCFMFVSLL